MYLNKTLVKGQFRESKLVWQQNSISVDDINLSRVIDTVKIKLSFADLAMFYSINFSH